MPALQVDTLALTLSGFGRTCTCVIGKSGAVAEADKREGDGKTPLGRYAIRALLVRPDRNAAPSTTLPWRFIRRADGWSDGVGDPEYNRPVVLPHAHSSERLWRDDGLYDLIVIIGHNDAPPAAGMGSAIFLHCMDPGGRPTEGCVALAKADLWAVATSLKLGDEIEIA